MSTVQFKILLRRQGELITYHEFTYAVLKTMGTFLEGKSPRDIHIQYQEDKDTFVNLSCNDNLIDAYRCLWPVDNCKDLYKLSLFIVHTTFTPVQAVHIRTKKMIMNEPAK